MLRTIRQSAFQRFRVTHIFSLRIGQGKTGKSILTRLQHQYRCLHRNHCLSMMLISSTSSMSEVAVTLGILPHRTVGPEIISVEHN